MRLSKIRIAGFKSFVDPVTLDLRTNLVGILGPNGCGKSNTIDAVRWVMGESSAKHLRGQSMEDVIFNGSSARKPVGQASVELVFDNSDGHLGGEYARYAEISVRRQVTRDGTSKYFLNGSRCRRRDITDIFLGTGLGPRSYAIIEQGMISRLIEAKPEELRNTLEEAAGISRYKERRRETQNRIKHTRENLERLADLREELEKQLQKLDRQAKAAAKFKALRADEQRLEASLLLFQQQALETQNQQLIAQLRVQSSQYQDQLGAVRALESTIEALRQQYTAANDALNVIQGEFYQAGADISRIEQNIRHQQETQERQQASLQQIQRGLEETLRHAEEDRELLQDSRSQLDELEPNAAQQQEALALAEERLYDAEEQLADWQEQWQSLQAQIADPTRQSQVEKTRMEQIEQQIAQAQQRLQRLEQDGKNISTQQFVSDISALERQLARTQEAQQLSMAQLETASAAVQQQQHQLQQTQEKLNAQRSRQQSLQGRLASLETLQQAGLDKTNKARAQWLAQQQLADKPRLAEQIEVASGWETALETVLGHDLDAVCVAHLDDLALMADALQGAGVSLLETTPTATPPSLPERGLTGKTSELRQETTTRQAAANDAANALRLRGATLATKIHAPQTLKSLCSQIHCADALADALAQRQQLADTESIITPTGIWLGRHWLRLPRKQDAAGNVLQRQQEIRQLQQQAATLAEALAAQEAQAATLKASISQRQSQRQQAQDAVNHLHREESTATSQLNGLQQRIQQLGSRQQQISREQEEVSVTLARLHDEHEQATERRNSALALLESLEENREQLAQAKDERQYAQDDARREVRDLQDELHQLQLEIETQRNQCNHSQRQLERVNSHLASLEQQRDAMLQQIAEQDHPTDDLQDQLAQALETRAALELRLSAAREQVQALDNEVRSKDADRVSAERSAETMRNQQEQLKLDWQSIQVRLQTLQEQFAQTDFDGEQLQQELQQELQHEWTQANVQQQLDNVQHSIQRLGAINLAAIEEFAEQSERKTWLDEQNDDLESALETLESAMRKIDRETRTRFRETFDHVNSRLQAMFPRLFGGGECYLEMTDDDLLTTGIMIMARPPGKRISSIHLMSGGEKALTAVALVFAIFELNPAPFCMLDEVDAPLDEANVGRFCDLVGDMAERVQFIFITHNKRTMELADNLIGVTMREPGVSRLVAVDMAEAVQLAEV